MFSLKKFIRNYNLNKAKRTINKKRKDDEKQETPNQTKNMKWKCMKMK